MSQTTHIPFGGVSVTTACLKSEGIPATTGQRPGQWKTGTDQPVMRTRWAIKIQNKSGGALLCVSQEPEL